MSTPRAVRIARRIAPALYVEDTPAYRQGQADVEHTVQAVLDADAAERGDKDLTLELAAAALDDKGETRAARLVRDLTLRDTTGRAQQDPPTGTLPTITPPPGLRAVPDAHRRDVTTPHLLRKNRP